MRSGTELSQFLRVYLPIFTDNATKINLFQTYFILFRLEIAEAGSTTSDWLQQLLQSSAP